jgi:hypothetical protein
MLTQPKVCAKFKWTEMRKCPVKIACKRGPGCENHDWWYRSPLRVICKDGPQCKIHDWAKFGITGATDDKADVNIDAFTPPNRGEHVHWMGCNLRYPGCHTHIKQKHKKLRKKNELNP